MDKALAEGILKDRRMRRKFVGGFAGVMRGMFTLGMFAIDGWLKESPVRFGIYWGACALLCLFVMMFALFDALAVIKEEREKNQDS